jgi:hypothetical protein
MILGFLNVIPLKLDNTREIHAVLAQVADPLRLVPLEFQTDTSRM